MIRAPETLIGQLMVYAVGGGAVTALHALTYLVLAEPLRTDPYLANTLAAVAAAIVGYVLHSRWTFGHTNTASALAGTSRYIVVSLICYALNSFWVWLLVDRFGASVAISIVPMILVTPWLGFALNRHWTFTR